ncbi:unnamed protein product [Natator depressus]
MLVLNVHLTFFHWELFCSHQLDFFSRFFSTSVLSRRKLWLLHFLLILLLKSENLTVMPYSSTCSNSKLKACKSTITSCTAGETGLFWSFQSSSTTRFPSALPGWVHKWRTSPSDTTMEKPDRANGPLAKTMDCERA